MDLCIYWRASGNISRTARFILAIPVEARCTSTAAVAGFRLEIVNAPLELTRFDINAAFPKVALMDADAAP
ncbi:hypothetical protein [Rhizobium leguminosarum]|uniref:hypothetical protein n=1 Tax=Rhizobium leguminosarum TaxID=384 RepID=UPI001FDF9C46|nr:hypothetical protein [Rhizobium leguminosarum]